MYLRPLSILVALTSGFIASSASAEDKTPPPSTGSVSVDVASFRNEKGSLGCRLFASAAGFPEAKGGLPFAQSYAKITGTSGRCIFKNVPAGNYAVAVLHEENLNGKLDTNFFGAPTEGYGVSNNKTYAMSAPKWDESKFVVGAGQEVRLAVSLRY
jgi:uncharacterized protein (DUF2141 family)